MFLENHLDTQILHFGRLLYMGWKILFPVFFFLNGRHEKVFFLKYYLWMTYAVCGNDNEIIEIFPNIHFQNAFQEQEFLSKSNCFLMNF